MDVNLPPPDDVENQQQLPVFGPATASRASTLELPQPPVTIIIPGALWRNQQQQQRTPDPLASTGNFDIPPLNFVDEEEEYADHDEFLEDFVAQKSRGSN